LARGAEAITVLDVVEAIEGEGPAFRCSEIRQRGPARVEAACYPHACGIARTMWAAEDAWREVLRTRTIADLVGGVLEDADPRALVLGAQWLRASAR
jgi:DNA-binding IscR family transcriptional regulator